MDRFDKKKTTNSTSEEAFINLDESDKKIDLSYETDSYLKNIERQLNIKKTFGHLNENLLPALLVGADENLQIKIEEKLKNDNMLRLMFWTQIFAMISVNALVYPRVLKFVRARLQIRSFWPLHLAAFSPMVIMNSSLGGINYGVYNYYKFVAKLDMIKKFK